MPPTLPFWFKQRQCKAEPAGSEHAVKVSGPNLGEAYLSITPADGGRWNAALRTTADGPAAATAEGLPSAVAAWEAAFELFRDQVIN
jgi:hypothetical protein